MTWSSRCSSRLMEFSGEITREFTRQLRSVMSHAVDEVGSASAHEAKPKHVETGCGRDATVVDNLLLRVEDRDVQPAVVTAIPGSPHDGPDALGHKIDLD